MTGHDSTRRAGGPAAAGYAAAVARFRTRNDNPSKPSYVTPEGYRRLEEEAARLWSVERPAMTRAVAEAAAEGDRSENAEYIYGKKRLREIDRRLAFLSKRLDALTIVDQRPDDTDRVFFGAWVTLEDEEGARVTYRIVGPDETDPHQKHVSVESPMARALLGKRVGDEVEVPRPRGEACFTIEEIRFRPPPEQGDGDE
jgi:transcription elongation factor GreB